MFRKFLASDDGNLALVFAIATVPIMAAVAGGVDFVSVNNKGAKLQDALDTAAIAVATRYYSGMSAEDLEEIGRDFFLSNVNAQYTNPEDFDYIEDFEAEATTIAQEDHIAVRSSVTHEGMIGSMIWKTERESVVRIAPGEPACVLALDQNASAAIKIQGSAQIEMNGCRLASNSDAADAVSRGGAATLSAECVFAVGGTSGLEGISNVELDCGSPLESQNPAHDPFATLQPPPYDPGCAKVPGGKTKMLSPGTYCNETLSGEITLEPGTYILRGGEVKLGGNGSLTGHGVTLVLMEDAAFDIGANQMVQLSPPASGDFAGITIYQERGNTAPLTVNGGAGSEISGFIYAPSAHVFHAGNSTMTTSGCLRIVGNTVEMTGNSGVSVDCEEELGGKEMYAGRYMVIVR